MTSDERLQAAFLRTSAIMRRLRRECPWDRRQTFASLRRYLLEECHEVLEALDLGDRQALRGELGDLLFQVWFHAEIASEEEGGFDLADVLNGICEKLTRRHPHVFSDAPAADARAVRRRWDELKMQEGRRSRLEGMPPLLPALLAAQVLQDKAASAGFAWPDASGEIAKVREEIAELTAELESEAAAPLAPLEAAQPEDEVGQARTDALPRRRSEELGDLLFALVGLGRRFGLNAEDALRAANRRFTTRFRFIEEAARARGQDIQDLSLQTMLALWHDAKACDPPYS
jgi:tetrapyrrole methylase family protein / MazG family protein